MYEGAPNYPRPDRFWAIIEKYSVTIFYTAPTAIRAFIKWGDEWPTKHDLVEPAPARHGRRADQSRGVDVVSRRHRRRTLPDRRHLVADRDRRDHDHAAARRDADQARLGDAAVARRRSPTIVDEQGKPVGAEPGRLPGHPQALAGDAAHHLRRRRALQEDSTGAQVPACYFTGDGARRDEDGYFWVMGRVDDVLNVAGHRLGTMEVESALVTIPAVAEAAVVGRPDEIKGEAIAASSRSRAGDTPSDDAEDGAAASTSRKEIGALAEPDEIRFTDALPKTRSGKIMRRLLRDIAAGSETTGDTTTLEDLSVLAKLREEEE